MTTILTADGMIPVPEELRRTLKLSPGQPLELVSVKGSLIARPLNQEDPFQKWRGRGHQPDGLTVNEYLDLIRDDYSR